MKMLFTGKILSIFIFLVLTGTVFGQATISGIVTDSLTNEALFGASVVILGTSQGAATDFNGEYKIPNVAEGNIKIKVSYVGYATKTLDITIKGQKTLELFIQLNAKTIEGKTVEVTAQAQGQMGAINQQLSSNTIINVVAADKIRQLPDDNAATALSRLPGVSLMNGDQVVIRGIQAKLNQVLINGIQMPSTDMNNRSTNLGFISSNMLAGIEVIKAITPDMDANTVGGVVNLKLASAPSGLHFDFMAQGNYNSTDRTTNTYKVWGSVSNRFFDDAFGVFVQGNADRSDGGNQSASIGLSGPNGAGSLRYGEGTYITTSGNFGFDRDIVDNRGGSIILDYKLPHGKIIMQNTYATTINDQRNNTISLDFNATRITYGINRNKFGKELWINSLQAENSFGDIKVEGSLSHSYTDQYTKINYDNYGGPWISFQNGTSLQQPFGTNPDGSRIIYTSQSEQMNMPLSRVYGIFNNINPADADSARLSGWPGAGKSAFKQHLYNAALDVSIPVSFSNDVNATFKTGGKFIRTTRTNDFDRYFAGQDPYAAVHTYFGGGQNYLSVSSNLKFNLVRDNNFTRGKYFLQDEYNFTNGFPYVINTDIYDPFLEKAISGWVIPIRKDQSYKDDWNGAEMFTAGYLMGTFNIFDNITLLGGVRFESYNMQYHAQYTFVSHSVDGDCITTAVGTIIDVPDNSPYANTPWTQLDTVYNHHAIGYSKNNVNRTDNNFFPDIQLKYKVNDWSDIRVAYTTGISRPDYSAILPKVAIYPFQNIEMGNPLLRPTKAKNIDIIASVYSNKIGLFTINGFYKELKDVIYNTSIYYSQAPIYAADVPVPDSAFLYNHFGYTFNKNDQIGVSLNNPNKAYIRGVEVDWQTNFWYLPEPFNSLVLNVNYTKSGSNLDYRILTPISVKERDPITGRIKTTYTTRDTTFSGRLNQQSNDVLNVALGIDYKGFSGRLSFNMRGNVVNGIGSRPEETSYTGNIYSWDFTLKQNLPVDGLSVSLNGINIFHNAIKTYRDYRLNPQAPITKNLVAVLYAPTLFQMNLRYTF